MSGWAVDPPIILSDRHQSSLHGTVNFPASNFNDGLIFVTLQDFKTSRFGLSRLGWGLDKIVFKASAPVSEDFMLVED